MKTVTVGRAVRLINSHGGAMLLAAMDAQEFAADHIPGSSRMELRDDERCERVVKALGGAQTRVILYSGRSGPEAYQAAQWLEECGFEQVLVLAGGLERWQEAGYATARDLGRDQLSMSQEQQDRELLAASHDEGTVAP